MKVLGLFVAGLILVVGLQQVEASGLATHSEEVALAVAFVDTEGHNAPTGGTTGGSEDTAVGLSWLHAFGDGRFQMGGRANYVGVNPDGSSGTSEITLGPLVVFNPTPAGTATAFVSAEIASVEGDAGDLYDIAYTISVGVRAFVGDSASVNVAAFGSRLTGPDDDRDRAGITAGVSFFFGSRAK